MEVGESPRTLSKSAGPAFNVHDRTDIQVYNCSTQKHILAVFNSVFTQNMLIPSTPGSVLVQMISIAK